MGGFESPRGGNQMPSSDRRPSAPLVISLIALFVSLGGAGYAASGGNFILGQSNSASNTSLLTAPVPNQALKLRNLSTTAGATALGLEVRSGHAPMTVNSGTKVVDLNADRVDGITSQAFLQKGVSQSADVDEPRGSRRCEQHRSLGNGVQGTTASRVRQRRLRREHERQWVRRRRPGRLPVAMRSTATTPARATRATSRTRCTSAARLTVPAASALQISTRTTCAARARQSARLWRFHPDRISSSARRWRDSCGCRTSARVPPRTLASSGFTTTPAAWRMSSSRAATQIRPTTTWAPERTSSFRAPPAGDSWSIQAQGALGVQTIQVATVHRASDCHAQAQALLTS